MKYYIACRLENTEHHNKIRDLLKKHQITYDWTLHGPVWQQGYKKCREVANREIQGVIEAEVLIMLSGGGRGTHVELGVALTLGKPVLFLTRLDSDIVPNPNYTAFYAHENITIVNDVYEILNWMDQCTTK